MELSVSNLTKYYGMETAVDNVSFKLADGEMLGFLGPNGAGKTTTLRMLSCFMSPASGNVTYNGQSIFDNPGEYKRKIGYLPEHNPLYPEMFIPDYLNFAASLQGLDKRARKERLYKMIEYCGLEKAVHKKIGELSKGYRQRVGLAQAMIHDPELLILDEPTSGLDPNQIVEIREFIKRMGAEKAVLLSSHILSEVEASCDRIVIIHEGKIVADDSSAQLKNRMQGQEKIELELEAEEHEESVKEAIGKLEGVKKVEHISAGRFMLLADDGNKCRKDVSKLCAQKGWTILELTRKESSLEDIFREITQ